jgi:hypothetical protein
MTDLPPLSKFDEWLMRHQRIDAAWIKTEHAWLKARRAPENWRNHREFRPGTFYLDHGYTPMILIELDEWDMLRGISLVDGNEINSDLYHCGPVKVTEAEAKEQLKVVQAEKAAADGGA